MNSKQDKEPQASACARQGATDSLPTSADPPHHRLWQASDGHRHQSARPAQLWLSEPQPAPASSFLSPLWGLVAWPFAVQGLTPLATDLGSSGARIACSARPFGDRLAGAGWPRLFQPAEPELAPAFTPRSSRCALGPSNAEPHALPRTTTSKFVSPTF